MASQATPPPEMRASLDVFPNEIILHILDFLPPEDNLVCAQRLSKHLNRLANEPVLWREHCRSSFKYWNPDHEFQKKLELPVADVDWKRLFIERKERNARIALLFDTILATKVGRMRRFEQVCHLGYDAKDFLLEQCHVDESVGDVLARRHFANSLLDSIHRGMAIKEWMSLPRLALEPTAPAEQRESGPVPQRSLNRVIERCLAAFDMFVLHDQEGDIDQISLLLDDIASRFKRNCADFDSQSTRDKALMLNRWLRSEKLVGMESPDSDYRHLRNCFIGQALRYKPHASLPIISCAIYCSVAERVGLDARLCLFPSHVHSSVFSRPGETLDGDRLDRPQTPGTEQPKEEMYLDPFGKDDEVTRDSLLAVLGSIGWTGGLAHFLDPAGPQNTVLRTAHNIRAAFSDDLSGPQSPSEPYSPWTDTSRPASGASPVDRESAALAALWARLALAPLSSRDWHLAFRDLLEAVLRTFPGDGWMLERYAYPMCEVLDPRARQEGGSLEPIEKVRRTLDAPPPVRRRDGRAAGLGMELRVGQVFRHSRLNFYGVVTGWGYSLDNWLENTLIPQATEREAGEPHSQFYIAMRAGTMPLVRVHQQYITLVEDSTVVPEELFEVAGLYFKRFDRERCVFVSNLREQYPDD